jgi:hypothetical protein
MRSPIREPAAARSRSWELLGAAVVSAFALAFLGCEERTDELGAADPEELPAPALATLDRAPRVDAVDFSALLSAIDSQERRLDRIEAALGAIRDEVGALRDVLSLAQRADNVAIAAAAAEQAHLDVLTYALRIHRAKLESELLQCETFVHQPPSDYREYLDGNVVRLEEIPGDPAKYAARAELLRSALLALEDVGSIQQLAKWRAEHGQR